MKASQVYALARGAGLSHDQAVTATAIAWAESGLRPGAVGDVSLQDTTWGPSIGLWQIRSVKADRGTGRPRDAAKLKDPTFNASSMASISGGGRNWGPWSTYTNGAYRSHLAAATAAAGGATLPGSTLTAPTPTNTMEPVGWIPSPGDLAGGLGHLAGGIWNDGQDLADAVNPIPELLEALTVGVIMAAALGLGATLIVIGAWRAAT